MSGEGEGGGVGAALAALDDLETHASPDIHPGWVMIPTVEWGQGVERLRAALAAALEPEQGWQPIETAVSGPIVGLTAGGRVVKMERGTVEGEDGTVGAWVALEADQHPPCWDDGYCWASSADGEPSDPPVLWTRLPTLPAPPEPTP